MSPLKSQFSHMEPLLPMNNETLEEKYLRVIDENDNVSDTSDFKELLILVGGFFVIFGFIFITLDFWANIYITLMPDSQQIKIENTLSSLIKKPDTLILKKHVVKMHAAEEIKQRLIEKDPNLQHKSNFLLYEVKNKNLNAFVGVDGNIYFTSGLLEEIKNKEELAFVLAHELGHYSKKHHLKAFSRAITFVAVASLASAGQSESVKNTVNGLVEISNVKYSQDQEKEADLYASNALKALYGSNRGGVSFFKTLLAKSNYPEFLYIFSTHPHPKERIKFLNSH